ncbi:MAG: DUF86 domain-containing protein [Sulfurovum sp.]|nr:DUF86 domain-containing protein [Sulfurovum sp.]
MPYMYDKELAIEILTQISDAVNVALQRFEVVSDVSYFTDTPSGKEKLDSICMLLIAIGESIKNIDKISGKTLLIKYPHIDWKAAKGMRDIVAHHYFDIDAGEIYFVCENKLEELGVTIDKIRDDLK